ncbi:MAG: signal peptide peptidase SppA [Candidatus Micrarchaeia archaeon]|jgi:protease-4
MAFESKKSSSFAGVKKNNNLLYGVILLLAVGFFILVGLVFIFADSLYVGGDKCVGVIELNGEIMTQSTPQSLFSEGIPGSEDIARTISSAGKRSDLGALVVVINSPGGSVVGSRDIYTSLKELDKPTVSCFREVAASGGYYIAAGTDYIVSDPDALTGSIGVIMSTVDASVLLEKVGLNMSSIVSGNHKDIGSPYRPMTSDEYAIMQSILDETFEEFKMVVLEGRKGKLDMDKFNQVLDARVVSGRQAKAIGLVDQLGTKKDAVLKAAELANIPVKSGELPRICIIKATAPTDSSNLFGMDSFVISVLAKMNGPAIGLRYE